MVGKGGAVRARGSESAGHPVAGRYAVALVLAGIRLTL